MRNIPVLIRLIFKIFYIESIYDSDVSVWRKTLWKHGGIGLYNV